MSKRKKIIVSGIIITLIALSSIGGYLYFNNGGSFQQLTNLKVNNSKNKDKQSDNNLTDDKSVDELKDNQKVSEVSRGFETYKKASDDETNETKKVLESLSKEVNSVDTQALNDKYFIDDRADWLMPYIKTGYTFDISSLEVYKTKKDYLLEWGMYLKKNSLKKRIVGTYDKNMKLMRIIEIK